MTIKKKKWKFLFFGLFLWVTYSWLSGDSGVVNQIQIYHSNKSLLHKIDDLTREKSDLDRERARLRSDTAYLEKIIRAELGMAKPGEKVYRLYIKDLTSGTKNQRSKTKASLFDGLFQLSKKAD